jgi:outer membrane biogenesis lipoprotein LolB
MRALLLPVLPFVLIACGGGSAPPAKAPSDDDQPKQAKHQTKDEKAKS